MRSAGNDGAVSDRETTPIPSPRWLGPGSRVLSRGAFPDAGWVARYAITGSMTTRTVASARLGLGLLEGRFLVGGAMERVRGTTPSSDRIEGQDDKDDPKHCECRLRTEPGDEATDGQADDAGSLGQSETSRHHAATIGRIRGLNKRGLIRDGVNGIADGRDEERRNDHPQIIAHRDRDRKRSGQK